MHGAIENDPRVRENLQAMLEALKARLAGDETSPTDYARTLSYLRFRIGEGLYEEYAAALERAPSRSN